MGVLFYFSILESGEYEAGLQEEDDECLSCNIDTTVIKPPFRGLVYGLTVTHIMLPCRRLIIQISVLVFHAPDQKRSEETLQIVPSNPRKGMHMLQPSLFLLKSVNTVL